MTSLVLLGSGSDSRAQVLQKTGKWPSWGINLNVSRYLPFLFSLVYRVQFGYLTLPYACIRKDDTDDSVLSRESFGTHGSSEPHYHLCGEHNYGGCSLAIALQFVYFSH